MCVYICIYIYMMRVEIIVFLMNDVISWASFGRPLSVSPAQIDNFASEGSEGGRDRGRDGTREGGRGRETGADVIRAVERWRTPLQNEGIPRRHFITQGTNRWRRLDEMATLPPPRQLIRKSHRIHAPPHHTPRQLHPSIAPFTPRTKSNFDLVFALVCSTCLFPSIYLSVYTT